MRKYIWGPKSCPGAKILEIYSLLLTMALCQDLHRQNPLFMQLAGEHKGKFTGCPIGLYEAYETEHFF